MHTKKINNTNKLPFYPYKNSKITKLKKKKNLFSVPAGIAPNWPVRNVGVSILVYVPIWYIPASTIGTDTVLTTLALIPNLGILGLVSLT